MKNETQTPATGSAQESKKSKRNWIVIIILAIIYMISPIDLLPEGLIGPGGYADDAMLLAYLLKKLYDFWKRK